MDTIDLTSPAFGSGEPIPERYTGDGADLSPPLRWKGVPDGADVLALLVEDPDAPGGTFTHWVAGDFDATINGFEEGEVPASAVEGTNDFDETGYRGPLPPEGDDPHRYFFLLLAVNQPLNLQPGATADDLREALDGKAIARGELIGTYAR
ncbi:MAG: YbhB/YbcL family Raf kinase inhibitor-like protein [Actinobacteria bacterium]|nr:YbhB/YbcL family Raf kinase inhibitor-like protein [Actinomycetota bacterium]